MAEEQKTKTRLEIGHVLFIDVVGYSKLLIKQQSELLRELNEVVSGTNEFREADSVGKLIRLPTGDGMALVFRTDPEAPAQCAMEIARALKSHPAIQLRMGIHSGPVNEVADVNQRANIAGAGINMAQRVMDCGDAGHILLSRHAAEDLEQDDRWRPLLHDLGTCEVKHGMRVGVISLYSDEVGNPQLPKKFLALKKHRSHVHWAEAATALLIIAAVVGAFIFFLRKPTRAVLSIAEKSIAVLPFENLSEEKTNAFFADGVQDEILTDLARIADLKVISRSSAMHYKSGVERNLRKIGEELGVAHVLEGSVQRAGNRVRVNAQLIDARTDAHLWAQTYDRDLADVFAIQSEIAKTIAEQLRARLSPGEKKAIEQPPTTDITAFDLYSHAKNLSLVAFSRDTAKMDLEQAADFLTQAVTRDPSFFEAYCQLAFVEVSLYSVYDHTRAHLAAAEAAVQAAARLHPDAGETHLARARNRYWGYLDYDSALAELELARQSLPGNDSVFSLKGYIERRQGRWGQSITDLEHAISLDPRNVLTIQQTAQSYQHCRQYAEAKSTYGRILAFEPNDPDTQVNVAFVEFDSKADIAPLHQVIDSIRRANPAAVSAKTTGWFLCAMAERDGAAAQSAITASGENPPGLTTSGNIQFNVPFIEGVLARIMKEEGKAQSAFAAARIEQERIVQAEPNYALGLCALGLIDAGLGRKEDALREGRRAVELLPIEKDAVIGGELAMYFAMIAAWVGDKDLAFEQLTIAVRRPGKVTYGQLKLLPWWDALRDDPRFEKILEEAKKPIALKDAK